MKFTLTILAVFLATIFANAQQLQWNRFSTSLDGSLVNGGSLTNLVSTNLVNVPTNSYEILINTNGSFYANGQFFPNVGTTSGGIMEAFTNGVQALTGSAANNSLGFANCIWFKFAAGYHFFSTQVILSNTFNVDLVFEGKGLKSTKLVYTGNQTGIATIQTMSSSVNSGASLNKPQFIMIRDIGFAALNDTTNCLFSIGPFIGLPSNAGLDAAIIERANFSDWWVMTNTQNGAELTAAGSGTPPTLGLIGLRINSVQEHGITINNVYFGGLATGMQLQCDHLYVRDIAAGNVGFGVGGTNLWSHMTPASPYALGSLIIDQHSIEAAYENIHCYTAPVGICFIPQPGQNFTIPATVENLETEVSPIGIACSHTETPTIFNPNLNGAYQDCYLIASPDSGAILAASSYYVTNIVNPASVAYGCDTYNGDGVNPLFYVRIAGTNVFSAYQNKSTFLLNPSGNGAGITNISASSISVSGGKIPTAVTLTASPCTFTNNTQSELECYFSGSVAYSVTKNGVGVFGSLASDGYFLLQPTNRCVITYTVAPTLYTNAHY